MGINEKRLSPAFRFKKEKKKSSTKIRLEKLGLMAMHKKQTKDFS